MEKIICWLFVKAQDMRSLLKVSQDILVVTFDEIKLNPLEPVQGMKTTEWASVFADLWIQAFRLYEGSKGFLIECLNTLYFKYKISGHIINATFYGSDCGNESINHTLIYNENNNSLTFYSATGALILRPSSR